MKAYKGFDKELKCRGFKYEIGKEYEEDKAKLCESGFHACEYPLDVFSYYPPNESRYCEVDLDATDKHDLSNDSKICGKKIKIGAEIGISGIVKASVEYIISHTKSKEEKISNTGNWSAATNTGYRSAATNTGDMSAAIVTGIESVACALGIKSKAKGALGCYIVLAEYGKKKNKYYLKYVKSHKVDGKTIEPNVFYTLLNGKFIKVLDTSL